MQAESRERKFFVIEISIDEEGSIKEARKLQLPDECTFHAKFMTLGEDLNKRSYFLKYFNRSGVQSFLVPVDLDQKQTDNPKFLQTSLQGESVLKMVRINRNSAEFVHLSVEIFPQLSFNSILTLF